MSPRETKQVSESRTVMTQMVMPNDTNPIGNLMGGNLMRWMDIAGGICAAKHSEAHVVTASVDNVSFSQPIHLGDVVTIEGTVTRSFRTSMEIYLEIFAEDIKGGNARMTNSAYMTFVALDDDKKKPIPVPQITPLTTEQQKRYDAALRRRQLRLILAGRLKPDHATELKSLFFD
ncbi:MAG TPA: acyl-CoA thioesterase [Saprospiraceae bacterium]|nr:acyl-CoA thioesterase [Saprospiraceae bacterium]